MTPKRNMFWKLSPLQNGQSYPLSFMISLFRENAPKQVFASPGTLHFVNSDNATVMRSIKASTGMMTEGSSDLYGFGLTVPSVTDETFAYTLALPQSVDTVNNKTELLLKTYLANMKGAGVFSDVIVYSTRGEQKTCKDSLSNGQQSDCIVYNNMLPGETLENFVKTSAKGYAPNLTFVVNQEQHFCFKNLTDQLGCDTVSYEPAGGTNLYDMYLCPNDAYCDKTGIAGADTLLNASVQMNATLNAIPASTSITVWNWYVNATPLWNNQQEHLIIFKTKENGLFYPGYFELVPP
jgi:hypothetical protein